MSEEQHRKILELFRERTQLQREIRQRLESVQEITRQIAALDKGERAERGREVVLARDHRRK